MLCYEGICTGPRLADVEVDEPGGDVHLGEVGQHDGLGQADEDGDGLLHEADEALEDDGGLAVGRDLLLQGYVDLARVGVRVLKKFGLKAEPFFKKILWSSYASPGSIDLFFQGSLSLEGVGAATAARLGVAAAGHAEAAGGCLE